MSLNGYSVFFNPKRKYGINNLERSLAVDKLTRLSDLFEAVELNSEEITDYHRRRINSLLNDITTHIPSRVICAPSMELKSRQRSIMRSLQRIPVHRGAHGFVKGKNSHSCAQAHLSYWGSNPKGLVLLNADVSGFFHSISRNLVIESLVKHGISEASANTIADQSMIKMSNDVAIECIRGLCLMLGTSKGTTAEIMKFTKAFFWNDNPERAKCAFIISKMLMGTGPNIGPDDWFLPQGAPTSPVLSNLVCKIIDIRLSAMAKSFNAFYTRYADDITFSWVSFTKGKVIDGLKRCSALVFEEYGFEYNPKKIRVVGPGGAQDIVGLVINSGRPTVSQRFRKKMRSTIVAELKSKAQTRPEVINRLTGQAGYIQPFHEAEALWVKESVIKLQNKTNRKVSPLIHGEETFESPSQTVSRKVSVVI